MKGCRRGWRVERGSLTETEGDPSADAEAVGGSNGSDGSDGGARRKGGGGEAVAAMPLLQACGRRGKERGIT